LGFYVNDTPSGWVEVDGALERVVEFENFAESLAFVNRVGEAAEEAGHHPDVEIHWNRVKLRWWTHVTGSITDRDRTMAARTNELIR
jgi:4a-hydroxytetrahydrobiopterin dehydratase